MLAYGGLPFEETRLRFDETRRAARTLGAEQVRPPLDRHGLEQRRHFEAYRDPLKAALGPMVG